MFRASHATFVVRYSFVRNDFGTPGRRASSGAAIKINGAARIAELGLMDDAVQTAKLSSEPRNIAIASRRAMDSVSNEAKIKTGEAVGILRGRDFSRALGIGTKSRSPRTIFKKRVLLSFWLNLFARSATLMRYEPN